MNKFILSLIFLFSLNNFAAQAPGMITCHKGGNGVVEIDLYAKAVSFQELLTTEQWAQAQFKLKRSFTPEFYGKVPFKVDEKSKFFGPIEIALDKMNLGEEDLQAFAKIIIGEKDLGQEVSPGEIAGRIELRVIKKFEKEEFQVVKDASVSDKSIIFLDHLRCEFSR